MRPHAMASFLYSLEVSYKQRDPWPQRGADAQEDLNRFSIPLAKLDALYCTYFGAICATHRRCRIRSAEAATLAAPKGFRFLESDEVMRGEPEAIKANASERPDSV
jgi:hypothetical protein